MSFLGLFRPKVQKVFPRMGQLLSELRARGISYEGMSPKQFANFMDEMTGLTPRAHTESPEVHATEWLERLP